MLSEDAGGVLVGHGDVTDARFTAWRMIISQLIILCVCWGAKAQTVDGLSFPCFTRYIKHHLWAYSVFWFGNSTVVLQAIMAT